MQALDSSQATSEILHMRPLPSSDPVLPRCHRCFVSGAITANLPKSSSAAIFFNFVSKMSLCARILYFVLISPPPLYVVCFVWCVKYGKNYQAIGSNDDYVNAMAQHEDKLVVIKFYDQFCRACDEIRPRYEDLSRSLPEEEAMFYELEVRADGGDPSCLL